MPATPALSGEGQAQAAKILIISDDLNGRQPVQGDSIEAPNELAVTQKWAVDGWALDPTQSLYTFEVSR